MEERGLVWLDDKKNALVTILFLCGILLCFTLADLLAEDRVYSENENRILATKPVLNKDSILSGEYMEDYETYVTDQFISRDIWVTLKTRMDILLQKKDINGVYLGKDGYLLEQHLADTVSWEKVEKKLKLLGNLVERYGADVMLVPTADNIISDKLPANAPYFDQELLLDAVRETVGEKHMIEVSPILEEHAEEEIYYRTDHHWTSLGAYYGYLAWKEHTGRLSPYGYRIEHMETVSDDFLGTLHSRLNLPMNGDAIQIFPETYYRPVKVTYDFQTTANSLYEEHYLDTKNQYGYFLDDNHGFVEIQTDYHNGQSLFVIKDSYANCLLPLLTQHYETIYVVDLRYYHGKLLDQIDSLGPYWVDVLVLYDCMHFIEDFMYY